MLATGLVFGHDALAPVFGYPRFTDRQRNDLLYDEPTFEQSPGSRIAELGGASEVPATTVGDRLVRGAAQGVGAGLGAGPAGVIPGVVGGVAGAGAAEVVPDWAAPAAQITANVLGGWGAAKAAPLAAPAGAGARNVLASGFDQAAGALDRFTGGPQARGEIPTMRVTPDAGAPAEPTAVPDDHAAAGWRPLAADEAVQPGMEVATDQHGQQYVREPQPESGGAAATPPQLAEMSLEDYKANRKQGELNAIMEPPTRGEDNTTYVPGSVPTLAERMGDPEISQQETLLRQRAPNQFEPVLRDNNDARVRLYEEDMGSAPARRGVTRDIEELAQREQPRVLANAQPLDLRNVAQTVNDMLGDPRGAERDALTKVIGPLRDALYDREGKLKTDVRQGWGMIDNIRDKIDRANLDNSQEKYVVEHLMQIKSELSAAMDQATNGRFGEYQAKLAALFQKRNAMDVLQQFRTQFTNAQGNINFHAFHRWMLGLARERGAAGANPEMAIPDSTMQKLIAIDKDLKRSLNIDLGKARGSPTNLLFSLSKSMGLGLVHAAVHGGVMLAAPHGVANILAEGAMRGAESRIGAWNLGRAVNRHLAEPPPGRNFLADEP
jgi:hypothetical protein